MVGLLLFHGNILVVKYDAIAIKYSHIASLVYMYDTVRDIRQV